MLLCFSHLRWSFVFQRPQHLMTRAAAHWPVLFWEEPVLSASSEPRLDIRREPSGVVVATPVLPQTRGEDEAHLQRGLLYDWLTAPAPGRLIAWYYTPTALAFSDNLEPDLTVYDCMDELSAFKDPPPGMIGREAELLRRADLVFTGGRSLFQAKRGRHPRVFPFPSSVDAAHFAAARRHGPDPDDQAAIGRPRIGFFGVIDERMDLDLVARAAAELGDVHFVMLGPVVKIDPGTLPRAPNLHWLGPKGYAELPAYLGGWDAGWMPFALSAATRFISPTKTPEFLAAGLPVTSTAVPDVVHDYGEPGLVAIADASTIADTLRSSLAPQSDAWRARVAHHLAHRSWDGTWSEMRAQMEPFFAARAPSLEVPA